MNEDKFKVGDKVRVHDVARAPDVCGGCTGVVVEIGNSFLRVEINDRLLWYLPEEIELIEDGEAPDRPSVSRTAETITTFALENTDIGLYMRCKVNSFDFLDMHIVVDCEEHIDFCVSRYTAEAIVAVLTRALEDQ